MTGTAYGIGVGPGDPELMTLKGARLLERCEVVAYPAPLEGPSLARSIAAPHMTASKVEIPFRMALEADRFPDPDVYDRAAADVGAHLDEGRDVAILCEGDPFFDGSFMYLFARLAERWQVEVVPGVSSLVAGAAAARAPLAARNDILTVVPAPLPVHLLAARLALADAAVVVKLGRHFAKVRDVLERLNLARRARYVERATMDNERILPLDMVEADEVPYFSMILVHKRKDAWL